MATDFPRRRRRRRKALEPHTKPSRASRQTRPSARIASGGCLTFNNVAINRGSEVFFGLLIEVLPVDNAHLLEESGLAALARSEQQDLHEPLDVRLVAVDTLVYLLRFPQLLHLATREETVRKTYR